MTRRVVILSTADFDSAVWTNKQHLAVGLAAGMDVVFVESMGLRRPGLNRADLTRIGRALVPSREDDSAAGDPGPRRPRPECLTVVSPKVIPVHGSRAVRWVNRRLVEAMLLPQLGMDPDAVLWTFSPLTYGLEQHAGTVVYHSVDLLHTFPGVPAAALLAAERRLLAVADVVIASSTGVRDHLVAQGRSDVVLWENVADVELFREHRGHGGSENIGGDRLPRAIFAGNLTPAKVDFDLLTAVADADVPLALAGPVAIDGAGGAGRVNALLEHPGVTYLGNLGPQELAREVGRSQVGLIPYLVNAHTAGVFPMKVFEYLAAGLDVLSTPLSSLSGSHHNGLRLISPKAFPAAVVLALIQFTEEAAAGRSEGSLEHSWAQRIRQAESVLQVAVR
ncbi:hypothetical protein ABIB25_005471 [Nakamurella sp. UYEF19]|uniref:hypothetical protein n=1 Tax=Nakamurella sp. UYEF19 TaxID=1756392 RepID=UPI003392E832